MRILFDSFREEYKQPFGCIYENEKCRLYIDVPKSCLVKGIFTVIEREDGLTLTAPFVFSENIGDYQRYCCVFSLFSSGLYFYYFKFITDISSFNLYKFGDHDTNIEEGSKWQISCIDKNYRTPKLLQGKIMYQIFPDRFAADGVCDLSDKMTPFSVHYDKNEAPIKGPDEYGNWNSDFYGGNLKGIESKLPYLAELGVGIIYLNPIFKAYSNHRYDTCDYKKIDPMLGTEENFSSLCSKAGDLGIKIILDGVFSHTGDNSIYFDSKHIFGTGAVSNPNSPYRDWYDFSDFPNNYKCWWGIKSLPCVNEMTKSYIDYIISDEDSVIAHWMKLGAWGFRLDVADELPDKFIHLIRKRVKELNPEGIVIGEVWEDASNKCAYGERRKYFTHGELDGVMNYPFRTLIISLILGDISPEFFSSGVYSIYENYPHDALNCCMTILSTHDTKRIRTVFEEKLSNDKLNNAMMSAIAIQFFLPGIPCIYYGDETGMTGGKDPENRGWFVEKHDVIYDFYCYIGKLRNNSNALKYGNMELSADNNSISITRSYENITASLKINLTDFEIKISI